MSGARGRALLGDEDACDGFCAEGVGPETVDRFRGEGDEAAIAEEFGGLDDVSGVGGVEVKSHKDSG